MPKTLEDLEEIPGTVFSPSGRGWVNVNVLQCLECSQEDYTKIVLVKEWEELINHPLDPEGGGEGKVYELECTACGAKYQIGLLKISDGEGRGGSSVLVKDQHTRGKWAWLGCA